MQAFLLPQEVTQWDLKCYDVSLAYEIAGIDKNSDFGTTDSNLL